MMEMVREAREREERLRVEKEGIERDQLRWKREAERLAREKLDLLKQLEAVGLQPLPGYAEVGTSPRRCRARSGRAQRSGQA
jgi:hypothetical protein